MQLHSPEGRRAYAVQVTSLTGLTAHDVEQALVRLAVDADLKLREEPPPPPEWLAPVPFHSHALPSFPAEQLPKWLGDYVAAVAEATQTPNDLAGLLSLSVLATVCARVMQVEVWEGWRELVNLYLVVALDSGNRKTSVVSEVTAPLTEWQEVQARTEALAVAEAQTQRKILEASLSQAESAATKAEGPEQAAATARAVELARELAATVVRQVPRSHHGTILRVHESVFAPRPDSVAHYHLGSLTATAFRIGYVDHLRQLWRQDRQAVLDLIDLATGGRSLTLVDDWGDEPHAPRKILAAALKQIANSQRSNRARQSQRPRQAHQANAVSGANRSTASRSDLEAPPDAPL